MIGIAMRSRTATARPRMILGAREEGDEVFTASLDSGWVWGLRFHVDCSRARLNI